MPYLIPMSIISSCLGVEGVALCELVQMWIGEGLVKRKEGTHLMGVGIRCNYIKILGDHYFFHIVR